MRFVAKRRDRYSNVRKQRTDRMERASNRVARQRLSGRLGREYAKLVNEIMDRLTDNADLRVAILNQSIPRILDLIDFPTFRRRLQGVIAACLGAGIEAGASIGRRFGREVGRVEKQLPQVSNELARQASTAFVEANALELATQITATNERALRQQLIRVINSEVSIEGKALQIGELAGLDPRKAAAVRNFEARLVEQGVAPSSRARQVMRFRNRQLRVRGAEVAQTNVQVAIQQGERAFWEVAVQQGDVGRESIRKVWRTQGDDDVCPICEPLDGQVVGFDTSYSAQRPNAEGRIIESTLVREPPAHVQCRCFIEYQVVQ